MPADSQAPLEGSKLYFHTPTAYIHEHFLYPLCLGDFTCDKNYRIDRSNYDSFLFFYVRRGSGYLYYGKKRYYLREGDFCLIDCYQPHIYGTNFTWQISWIHFDGLQARNYYELISGQYGYVFQVPPRQTTQILDPLERMLNLFSLHAPIKEIWLTKYITDLLTHLLGPEDYQPEMKVSNTISERAMAYMQQNYHFPVSLEELAGQVSLNPAYFTRRFRQETGMTPHHYLISIRLQRARYYLNTTLFSVKEIAFSCGFHSENSFCITFKKFTGMTPTAFRETSGKKEAALENK